jgi:type I restriction enzyme S subunit
LFEKEKEKAPGGIIKTITKEALSSFRISYPNIEEQTRIATILSDMDAEIEALEQKLAKYRMIKQGMMQNLLTGKIRLV